MVLCLAAFAVQSASAQVTIQPPYVPGGTVIQDGVIVPSTSVPLDTIQSLPPGTTVLPEVQSTHPPVLSNPGIHIGPRNVVPSSGVSESPQSRSATKVALPSIASSEKTKSTKESSTPRGHTFVSLANGLERVQRGNAPSTLHELKLLEAQQSAVAEKIDLVTVNVQQGAAQGSGVIITRDGYVLTAAHVAGGNGRPATLILNDGTRVQARTLGMNRNKDAGLLKIEEGQRSGPWPYATLGRSRDLEVGQWVIAGGHPGGWNRSRGSVIRVGRVLKMRFERDQHGRGKAHTLWTDCPLIGGDSGGPLFTLTGELVGIHSRIGAEVEDNMHVPIDVFDDSWERMANNEVWGVLPGYQPDIGVVRPKARDSLIVEAVLPGSAASRAGLKSGDEVRTVDGQRITTFSELMMAVEAKMPGDVITLTIRRGESFLRVPIVVDVKEG